jgi:hypothetical protein
MNAAILFFKARRFKDQPGYTFRVHRWHSMLPNGERGGGSSSSAIPSPFKPDPAQAEAFRLNLDRAMTSRQSNVDAITVGPTPAVLQALGAPQLPISITRDVVRKATNGVKHAVSIAIIRQLPELLANPIMVFNSAPNPERINHTVEENSLVVLIDAVDEQGAPIIAAIHFQQHEKRHEVNRVASVYGKDRAGVIVSWMKEGLLRYRQTQKCLEWFQSRRLQLPKEGTTQGTETRILTETDIVKLPAPLTKTWPLPPGVLILIFKSSRRCSHETFPRPL